MALDLTIATGSSTPIYRQVVDQVRRAVVRRELKVGDQLPSVRVMAERLLVNHNTIAKAYGELVRDGDIESRHGKGVFVAQKRSIYTRAERSRRLDDALETFLGEAIALGIDTDEILQSVTKKLSNFTSQSGRGQA
ncbi:MAG: GntR family transcriptional regulator [Fuerstiella sp.]|nr:GntR family transcriptional regulator [Fuerstiella sp.]